MLKILIPLSYVRDAVIGVVAAMALVIAPLAAAAPVLTPVTWSLAGPGTLNTTINGNVAALTYNLDPAGLAVNTWTASATASIAGDYLFAWEYNGFHSFSSVTVFLNSTTPSTLVSAGPTGCCYTPSAGFSYNGVYTFANIGAGDTFGFTFGGSNSGTGSPFFPQGNLLQGSLSLTQIPEPGSLVLLGLALGLAGFAATRGRRQS